VNKQKPVAWFHPIKNGGYQITPTKKYPNDQPLYPAREWVGLTDAEIWEGMQRNTCDLENTFSFEGFVGFVEKALRKKNGY